MTRAAVKGILQWRQRLSNARGERTAPFFNGRFYFNEQHPSVNRSVARRRTKECHAECVESALLVQQSVNMQNSLNTCGFESG